MSNTYKKLPMSCMRNPRGRLNAIINGARHGAIPPSAWDDQQHDAHCYISEKAFIYMIDQGLSLDKIKRKLRKKFHLKNYEIRDLCSWSWVQEYIKKIQQDQSE